MKDPEAGAFPAWLPGSALAGAVLLFGTWTSEVFELQKIAWVKTCAIVALGTALMAWARRGLLYPRSPLPAAAAAFWAACAVSAWNSTCRYASFDGTHESFSGLPTVTAYVLLLLLGLPLFSDPARGIARVRGFFTVAAGSGAVCALYALSQWTGFDPLRWNPTTTQGRIFGTLGNANFLAGTLILLVPSAVGFAVLAERPAARATWLACAALFSVVTFLTQSRGGWIGLVLGLAALLAFARAFGAAPVGAARRRLAGAAAAVLVVGAAAAFVRSPLNPAPSVFRARLASLFDVARLVEGTPRTYIWLSAADMFLDHPLLGVGLDAFQQNFQRYRRVEYWRLEWHGTPTKAHNDYLHLAATTGAAGLLAFLCVAWMALRATWRAGRTFGAAGSAGPAALAAAVGAALVAYLVQCVFEFSVAATSTAFWLLAACGAGLAHAARAVGHREGIRLHPFAPGLARSAASGLAVAAAAAMLAWGVVVPYWANVLYRDSFVAAARGDLRSAVERLLHATRLAPQQEMYWVKLGLCYEEYLARVSDEGTRGQAAASAVLAYRRASELCVLNGYNYNNIARVRRAEGDREDALAWTGKACAADPFNAYFRLDRASVLTDLGRTDEADAVYSQLLDWYPDLRGRLASDPDQTEAIEGLLRAAARRADRRVGR